MNIPETYDYLVRARRTCGWRSRAYRTTFYPARCWTVRGFTASKTSSFTHPSWRSRRHPARPARAENHSRPEGHRVGTCLCGIRSRNAAGTLTYLAALTDEELKRIVILHDAPEERFTVDGLQWHVMIHEMRHTAQIAFCCARRVSSRLGLTCWITCHPL